MEELPRVRPPFEVRVERQGDGVFIALFGELDATSEELFENALKELGSAPVARLVIELSGLTFMDSRGLFLFLEVWHRFGRRGIDIVFEGASEQTRRLLEATGLDRVLPVAAGGPLRPAGSPASLREHEWVESSQHPTLQRPRMGALRPSGLSRR